MAGFKTFSSFKNPVFRLYYGGMLSQMGAMNMQMVIRPLLIYRLAGSAAILGLQALAHSIPMVGLSLFGGVIADRIQKKYIMLAGQAASAFVSLAVALALVFNYLSVDRAGSWWILIAASVLQGCIMGLMMPSRHSIIAEIVEADELMNAVALVTFGMNILRFITPAIGGFLVDLYSFKAVYFTTTGLYLAAVVFIAFLPLTGSINPKRQGALAELKDGLLYVRGEPTILFILLFALVLVVLSRPYQFLLPVFSEDILKVGATGLGILMSASGVGAMICSMILASLPNRRRGLILLLSGFLLSIALLGFAFSKSWILSLISIAFIGMGDTGRATLANTLVQSYVSNEYRGRVMSILIMEFGLMSFGVFFAGLVAEAVGVQWSIGGLAMILAVMTLLIIIFGHRLRRLE